MREKLAWLGAVLDRAEAIRARGERVAARSRRAGSRSWWTHRRGTDDREHPCVRSERSGGGGNRPKTGSMIRNCGAPPTMRGGGAVGYENQNSNNETMEDVVLRSAKDLQNGCVLVRWSAFHFGHLPPEKKLTYKSRLIGNAKLKSTVPIRRPPRLRAGIVHGGACSKSNWGSISRSPTSSEQAQKPKRAIALRCLMKQPATSVP